MRSLFVFVLLLTVIGSSGLWLTAETTQHPFSVKDLVTMDRISGQTVSPDGKLIVFVLRKTDMEANRGRTDLWLVQTSGKGLKQLTTDKASDYNPVWSKDGKSIFFLSSRSGSAQVWKIDVTGGKAVQVTDLPLNVGNLILSPDGKKIAFSMDVFPKKGCYVDTKKRLEAEKKRKATGRIYDRLFIRHWDTWNDGRRSHVFVKDLASKKIVNVMKGLDADSPTKPFGGSEEMTFTPDSMGIIFVASNSDLDEPWSTNFDLYHAKLDAKVAPKVLTEKNKAWDTNPVFSNDGKTLAYLAMKRPGFEADKFNIVLRDWKSGKERILTEKWDRSASSILWSNNNRILYVKAGNLGQKSLFSIRVKDGKVTTLIRDGYVRSAALAGKRIVYGLDNLKSPVELYSCDRRGRKIKKITDINGKKLAAVKLGDYEQFTFKGWNDETVYGYIVKPVDFDPNQKYPVAFLIHGGPQGSFGNDFHYRWNPQTYAGAGYAAVMIDFHGSTGYGQAFTDSISGDWGGKPLEDLQKGLAAALKKYPWMDGEKVGALGASYGGYMINWIAGNWSDRFKCLVNHDGNLDERLAYYDTEELWFPEWEHGGTPWDNPKGYEKHNPVNFVKNWKTPMLVIHGALDFRVVETQGFSTFTALQRKGIPSKLLYFPDENHWVLKPHNSILWHDTVIGWLDKWCK